MGFLACFGISQSEWLPPRRLWRLRARAWLRVCRVCHVFACLAIGSGCSLKAHEHEGVGELWCDSAGTFFVVVGRGLATCHS